MGFIQVCTCESILEKELLLSKLRAAGVEAESQDRSISRKYTDTTIDLSFGGYSTVMGGFKIYVNDAHEEVAREVVKEFIEKQKIKPQDFKSSRTDLSRFYLFSIFSIFIPILSHAFGLYFLIKAYKAKQITLNKKFIAAFLIFVLSFLVILVSFYFSY